MSEEEANTARAKERIGEVIDGRYKLIELLGEGGMGAVYVAEHLALHKEVAVKLIHASFAGNGDMRARFAREALASAKLDHPNVASAIDFGSLSDGTAYLVIQLVRGPSLDAVMGLGPIDWHRSAALGAQIADALAGAHALGIVHRDLKPDNVMLVKRDDGTELVKVLDFGIARVPSDGGKAPKGADTHRPLTMVGTVMGTPGYMSPEQALGEAVDHRADLYALGVMLWEMISGRYLFEGELMEVLQKQLTAPIPLLGEIVDGVPQELEQLVMQMLARKADDRPADAVTVRERLQQLVFRATVSGESQLSGLTAMSYAVRATPSTGNHDISGLKTLAGATASPLPPPPSPVKRTLTAIVALIVLLGAAAGGAYAFMRLDGHRNLAEVLTGEPTSTNVASVIPAEIAIAIETLVISADASDRGAAADAILTYQPSSDLPPYALALAELEKADGCRPRRLALQKVQALRDPAALPYVQRMRALPRRGCGPRDNQDCYGCIRADIMDAYKALLAASGQELEAEPTAEPLEPGAEQTGSASAPALGVAE